MPFQVEHRSLANASFIREMKRRQTREDKIISSLSAQLNVMIKACQKAGRRIIRDFGELGNLQVMQKAPKDFVTAADLTAEKILMESLKEDRPDYGFLSEEKGFVPASNGCLFTWIIDPIDGTTNFIHAIGQFAISLALKEKDEIVAGVVYNPVLSELYYAEKGTGAFLMLPSGTMRLRVSGRSRLSDCVLEMNYMHPKNPILTEKVADAFLVLRNFGSAALGLANVAAGRTDAYIGTGLSLWDAAAGFLLVKEAGGFVSNLAGNLEISKIMESKRLVATNNLIGESALKLLNGADVQNKAK
jgi:myo-inositol-1(or 4)-monophosphatase